MVLWLERKPLASDVSPVLKSTMLLFLYRLLTASSQLYNSHTPSVSKKRHYAKDFGAIAAASISHRALVSTSVAPSLPKTTITLRRNY